LDGWKDSGSEETLTDCREELKDDPQSGMRVGVEYAEQTHAEGKEYESDAL
jgi:hypothetical protein